MSFIYMLLVITVSSQLYKVHILPHLGVVDKTSNEARVAIILP